MRPRFTTLMVGTLIAVATLVACRKEVPTPPPAPSQDPKPTVRASARTTPAAVPPLA
jgi:hypothetical protein